MAHVTSSWAYSYCLEDPARLSDAIYCADGAAARAAESALGAFSDAVRSADHALQRGRRTVSDAWSATEPPAAAAQLIRAYADAATRCDEIAAAAGRVVSAITTAHRSAHEMFADADTTIVSEHLLSYRQEPGVYPGWDLPTMIVTEAERQRVDAGRRAVVTRLNRALDRVLQRLGDDVTDATKVAAANQWGELPEFLRPTVPNLAADRNRANLERLERDLALHSGPRHHLAVAVDAALREAAATRQTAQLVHYDPSDPPGQGSVAISIGDLDAATSVAIVVPGITNSPMTIAGSVGPVAQLNERVVAWAGADHGAAATIVWWGYDIPLSVVHDAPPRPGGFPLIEMLNDTAPALGAYGAEIAGQRLASFVGRTRAAMPPDARLTLLGFSWGAQVASEGARLMSKTAGVDQLITAGAPGVGVHVRSVDDYTAVDPDDVYAVALPGDPVTMDITDEFSDRVLPQGRQRRIDELGYDPGPYGADPTSAAFGANVVAAASAHSSPWGYDFGTHSLENYLTGESGDAIAAIVAGHGHEVPLRRPR